jgi:hypothetical protein
MNEIRTWRLILDIIAKHHLEGDAVEAFHPEHDEIWFNLSEDEVGPDSTDGITLKQLGCVIDDGRWKTFASL